MADKIIKGLSDGSNYNNITFSNVNNKPEEYTNVHSPLFNGDQLGFEVKSSYADGGFSKLINAITIDWQGAKMVNTARYLHLTDITLNNTSELIDIIERICMQLSNGTPIEPTWEITNIQVDTGATESLSVNYKKTTNLPTVYGIYTNEMSQEDRREITNGIEWSITSVSGTDYIELTEDNKIRGKKAGNATITATYKNLSCDADILVNKIDLESESIIKNGSIITTKEYEYQSGQAIQPEISLRYKYGSNKYEELLKPRDYSINYSSNNTGSVSERVTATMTVTANSSSNYRGSLTYTFTIYPSEEQHDYYWYCGVATDENTGFSFELNGETINIPAIESNIIEEIPENYNTPGWRYIDISQSYSKTNPLYAVRNRIGLDPDGSLAGQAIYMDGHDENGNRTFKTSVTYYVIIPSGTNLNLYEDTAVKPLPVDISNININNIPYNIYKFTGTELLSSIY